MPLLAALLVNLITGLAGWLLTWLTQKVAVAAAISVVLTAVIVGIFIAARAALQGAGALAGNVHPMFGAGVSMVISPRAAALISSYIAFWMLVELYKWKVNLIQLWARTI
jgi:hypothetical protein